jgi:hypothetical protein
MDEQQRLLERLPDYLHGHVVDGDAARIAALLESDPAWQAQAALLADVRDAVDGQMSAMHDDAGLDELRRRIASAPLRPTVPPPAQQQGTWWQRIFDSRLIVRFTPAIMATLVVVCVVQGWRLGSAPDTDVAWRDAALSVAAPAANLRVRFNAGVSLADVEAALFQAHARIITGPQGDRRYLLQAEDAAAALAQLRASAAVAEASVIPADQPAPKP